MCYDHICTQAGDAINKHEALLLPKNMDQIWTAFKDVTHQPHKLQRSLTSLIEARISDKLIAHSSSEERVRLCQLTMDQHSTKKKDDKPNYASRWITMLPVEGEYLIPNQVYRLATRMRLGLPAYDNVSPSDCPCNSSTKANDSQHQQSCVLLRRTSATIRHNNIMNVVMQQAREMGCYCEREPLHHQRQRAMNNTGSSIRTVNDAPAHADHNDDDEAYVDGHDNENEDNKHADILIISGDSTSYVDVSLVHPTAPSYVRAPSVDRMCEREKSKHAKYDKIAGPRGWKMVPFVMTSYGNIGKEAMALILFLSTKATMPALFVGHFINCLSVSLLISNFYMADRFAQQTKLNIASPAAFAYQHYSSISASSSSSLLQACA
jgi:hypothetical protein